MLMEQLLLELMIHQYIKDHYYRIDGQCKATVESYKSMAGIDTYL